MNRTVRTEQRYLDQSQTQTYDDHFNVYVGRTFIGVVHLREDGVWHWGTGHLESADSFEAAVAAKVANYSEIKALYG